MRVLWFTNSPSLAKEYLNIHQQGCNWIPALEYEISKREDIDLGVAFQHHTQNKQDVRIGRTQYYILPIYKESNKAKRIWNRWNHLVESDIILDWFDEIIQKFKPDVIHLFGTEEPYGLIAARTNIPTIIHIQGNLTVYHKKWLCGISLYHLLKYSKAWEFFKGMGIFHNYYLFAAKAQRERKIMQSCKYYMGRTDWDRRITRVLSRNGKYFHCDELLRDTFYQHQWGNHISDKLIITSTIGSATYKGFETILETANILKTKNISFTWNIIGMKGDEDIIKIFEKVNKQKFAEQHVVFQGSLSAESMVIVLKQSSCYVHPSHIENSPNSICEAMLLGLPIVATYAGGTSSIVKDNIEGLLVQDGDPYAMAGAILELTEDKSLATYLGMNARQCALDRHNPDKVVNDLINIYSSIVGLNYS